jgi:hypothetical protein
LYYRQDSNLLKGIAFCAEDGSEGVRELGREGGRETEREKRGREGREGTGEGGNGGGRITSRARCRAELEV